MAGRHIGYWRGFYSGDVAKGRQVSTRVTQQFGIMLNLMEKMGIERWAYQVQYPDGVIIRTIANPPHFYNAQVHVPRLVNDSAPAVYPFEFFMSVIEPQASTAAGPYENTYIGRMFWDQDVNAYYRLQNDTTGFNNNVLGGPYNIGNFRVADDDAHTVTQGINAMAPHWSTNYSPTASYETSVWGVGMMYWGDKTTDNHAILYRKDWFATNKYYDTIIQSPLFTWAEADNFAIKIPSVIYRPILGFTIAVIGGEYFAYIFEGYYGGNERVWKFNLHDLTYSYASTTAPVPNTWLYTQQVWFDYSGYKGKGAGWMYKLNTYAEVDYDIDPDTGAFTWAVVFSNAEAGATRGGLDVDITENLPLPTLSAASIIRYAPGANIGDNTTTLTAQGSVILKPGRSHSAVMPVTCYLLDDGVTFHVVTSTYQSSLAGGALTGTTTVQRKETLLDTCTDGGAFDGYAYYKYEYTVTGNRSYSYVYTQTWTVQVAPTLASVTKTSHHASASAMCNEMASKIDSYTVDACAGTVSYTNSTTGQIDTTGDRYDKTEIENIWTSPWPTEGNYVKASSYNRAGISVSSSGLGATSAGYTALRELTWGKVEVFQNNTRTFITETPQLTLSESSTGFGTPRTFYNWYGWAESIGAGPTITSFMVAVSWVPEYNLTNTVGGTRFGASWEETNQIFFVDHPNGSILFSLGEFPSAPTDPAYDNYPFSIQRDSPLEDILNILTEFRMYHIDPEGTVTDLTDLIYDQTAAAAHDAAYLKRMVCMGLARTNLILA